MKILEWIRSKESKRGPLDGLERKSDGLSPIQKKQLMTQITPVVILKLDNLVKSGSVTKGECFDRLVDFIKESQS